MNAHRRAVRQLLILNLAIWSAALLRAQAQSPVTTPPSETATGVLCWVTGLLVLAGALLLAGVLDWWRRR